MCYWANKIWFQKLALWITCGGTQICIVINIPLPHFYLSFLPCAISPLAPSEAYWARNHSDKLSFTLATSVYQFVMYIIQGEKLTLLSVMFVSEIFVWWEVSWCWVFIPGKKCNNNLYANKYFTLDIEMSFLRYIGPVYNNYAPYNSDKCDVLFFLRN